MFTLGIILRSKNILTPKVLFGLSVEITSKYETSFTIYDDACTWLEFRLIGIADAGLYFGCAFLGYGINIAFCNSQKIDDMKDE